MTYHKSYVRIDSQYRSDKNRGEGEKAEQEDSQLIRDTKCASKSGGCLSADEVTEVESVVAIEALIRTVRPVAASSFLCWRSAYCLQVFVPDENKVGNADIARLPSVRFEADFAIRISTLPSDVTFSS